MSATLTYDFVVRAGSTWRRTIQLFEDKARTKPANLTGEEVKLVLENGPTLTDGHGLTIIRAEGKITGEIYEVPESIEGGYHLFVGNSERILYPQDGLFVVKPARS